MNATLPSTNRLRKWGVRAGVGAALIVSTAGILAFRTLSARPGEGALRYIPADAMMVGTVDLSPSVSQTLAFKRIDDALSRNNLDGFLQSSLIDMIEPQAAGREALRPLVQRHGAMALLPSSDPKGEPTAVALLSVSSGQEAAAALQKQGEPRFFKGMKYFKLRKGNMIYTVVDDLLVMSSEPAGLLAVKQVRDGAPSITSVPAFVSSRANVAEDANLMVFMSPKIMEKAPKGSDAFMADWMTVGIAIRDGGIGVSFAGATDPKREPAISALGATQPVRSDLFRILPKGAYGAFVFSQPAVAFEAVESGLIKDEEMKKGMKEMEEGMRKEAGMDFRKDVLPAFRGTTIMAAYPTHQPTSGVDALVVMDDLHGGNPANAADRLSQWVEDQMEKEGHSGGLFTKTEGEGVTYYRISKEVEKEMQESVGESMAGVKKDKLIDDKTLSWAVVGRAVLASTSQALLERAVAAYQTNVDPLATDEKYASIQSEVLDGSQQIGMFSLSRIAEGIRNTMDNSKMSKEEQKNWNSILGAFAKLDQPFTTKTRLMTNGRFAGGTFIPMEYDEMLNFAGELKKQQK